MTAPRLAKLAPADLDPAQRTLYAAIAEGPRAGGPFSLTDDAGGLVGPFNAMLLKPELGTPLQALGAAVRYRTALTDRARETAILVVAAHWDSAFERYAHEAIGRRIGLTDEELLALREARYDGLTDIRVVAEVTAALTSRGDLTDDEYTQAVAELGVETVFELLTLVGYYATLALQLRVFRVAAPAAG